MAVITRHNLCANPSFEASLSGWTTNGTAPSAARIANPWPGAGSWAMKVTWTTGTSVLFSGMKTTISTTAGQVYQLSARVFVPSGSPPVLWIVDGVGLGGTVSVFDQWATSAFSFTATGPTMNIGIVLGPTTETTSSQFYLLDAVLVEAANEVLPYFDGDTPGASWDSTAQLSTSTLTTFETIVGLPQVVVEFDAAAPSPTEFILDSSLLDGADLLATAPRWVPVTYGLLEYDISRGRPSIDVDDYQPGVATLTFDNASGDFDTDNAQSVFRQNPDHGLEVGMACRISALWDAGGVFVSERLFTGRLTDPGLVMGFGVPGAVLQFVDDLAAFVAGAVPSYSSPVGNADTTGQRIAWAASLAPGAGGTPQVSASLTRALLPTYGGGSPADEMRAAVTAEAGRLFVDRYGDLVATAHADEYERLTLATLTDSDELIGGIRYESIQPVSGMRIMVNSAIVDRYNRSDNLYPSATAGDAQSVQQYGLRSVNVLAPLASDAEAQALAVYLATRRSTPQPVFSQLSVNFLGQAAAAPLLAADIGDQVAVSRAIPYQGSAGRTLSTVASIEGIRWSGSCASFVAAFVLGPIDRTTLFGSAGLFILDSSLLDGADVLAAY